MAEFKKMIDILKPTAVGDVEVKILDFTKAPLSAANMERGIENKKYVSLWKNQTLLMSDTPMERRTNRFFVNNAYGDVLICGLGLGMIILAIQDEPQINSITVIENDRDVIAAVGRQLPLNEKVSIVEADAFTFRPTKGIKFDCIYIDIWPVINSDIYSREMLPLKRHYSHYLKPKAESPNRFNCCWAERQAKENRKLF